MKIYAFRRYSAKYPALFRRKKAMLKKLLPKDAKIEHVGSTAVPGLGGKGVIDVMVSVDQKAIEKAKTALEKSGYEFKPDGGDRERLFFRKKYKCGNATKYVHVHLTFRGSHSWERHTAVRDYLRSHPEEFKEYENVKRHAVKMCKGRGKRYNACKESYMRKLEGRALMSRRKNP